MHENPNYEECAQLQNSSTDYYKRVGIKHVSGKKNEDSELRKEKKLKMKIL